MSPDGAARRSYQSSLTQKMSCKILRECCSCFATQSASSLPTQCFHGHLLHRDEAGISPFDSAVQGGDAVWEGLRLYNGRIFKLNEHLDRLEHSARALSFAQIPPREKIIDEVKRTLTANRMRDGVHIRLTLTRGVKITSGMDPRLNQSGPTLIILAEHKAPVYSKDGLKLITASVRRPPPEVLDARIHHANL